MIPNQERKIGFGVTIPAPVRYADAIVPPGQRYASISCRHAAQQCAFPPQIVNRCRTTFIANAPLNS